MSKLFRHLFLKKENRTQKRENNLNDSCDMAKVKDLRYFFNQAEKSIISNEIKSYAQPRKNYNTLVPERIKN